MNWKKIVFSWQVGLVVVMGIVVVIATYRSAPTYDFKNSSIVVKAQMFNSFDGYEVNSNGVTLISENEKIPSGQLELELYFSNHPDSSFGFFWDKSIEVKTTTEFDQFDFDDVYSIRYDNKSYYSSSEKFEALKSQLIPLAIRDDSSSVWILHRSKFLCHQQYVHQANSGFVQHFRQYISRSAPEKSKQIFTEYIDFMDSKILFEHYFNEGFIEPDDSVFLIEDNGWVKKFSVSDPFVKENYLNVNKK